MRWWWKNFCFLVNQVHLAHSSSVKGSETVEFGNMHHSRHMHTVTVKPMSAYVIAVTLHRFTFTHIACDINLVTLLPMKKNEFSE